MTTMDMILDPNSDQWRSKGIVNRLNTVQEKKEYVKTGKAAFNSKGH